MKHMKIGVILLALLLAAMAMVPVVSAADRQMYAVDWSRVAPTQPVAEKDLLTIITSENVYATALSINDSEFVAIPALDSSETAVAIDKGPGYIVKGVVDDSDAVTVIRLPRKMYDNFARDYKDGMVMIPKEFVAHYRSIADFEKKSADLKAAIEKSYAGNYTNTEPTIADLQPQGTRAPYTRYQRWQVFSSDPSGRQTIYLTGKINPSTFSRTGSGTIFCEEREIHLNRYDPDNDGIDVIELVVAAYTPTYPSGSPSNLNLYPVIYNGDINGNPIYLGYIPVSTTSLPHSYNFYVQLSVGSSSTTYDIWIQDTVSQAWLGHYTYTDSVSPSRYIRDVRVSAEFTTVNSPSTFNIRTNPITDEWIKVSGDSNWHAPSYAFSFQRLIENHPGQMLYVSTTGSFSGNGQLVTTSTIQGTTP